MSDEISIFDTPVGPLLARASDGCLIELSFYTHAGGSVRTAESAHDADRKVLEAVEAQIAEYFARARRQFELPLRLQGPAFNRRVWEALCEIPYGQTVSYGHIAAIIGLPDSARAVGAANGANPIAIVVPCHRVIGADGSLVGYGGGLKRKRLLLDLESANTRLDLFEENRAG